MRSTSTAAALAALIAGIAGCDLRQTGHTNPSLRPSWVSGANSAAASSGGEVAHVTATVDGDTFRADVDGRAQRIRVLGINAPEVRHGDAPEQCGGEAARTALDKMIWRHTVTLSAGPGSDERDQYGRLLRYVSLQGRDIGLAMIQQGRASEYHPRSAAVESRAPAYAAAQRAAERAKRGQWAICTAAQERKR